MKKKEIIEKLYALLEKNKSLTEEQELVIQEAIVIVKKSKTWDQCINAVEILVKLLDIGSNLF